MWIGPVQDCTIEQTVWLNDNYAANYRNLIGEYVHISPRVKTDRNVTVGKSTWLGIGSVVSNNVNICSECIVGAGAVVIRDITESGTYVGNSLGRIRV